MKLPFFPFYGQDFLADTTRLSRTLKSVYMDLLWYMWEHADETGRPTLPDDPETISSRLGCDDAEWIEWRRILTKGKTAAFLTVSDGELSQKRLTEEWNKARAIYFSKSKGGKSSRSVREDSSKTLGSMLQDSSKTLGSMLQDSSKTLGRLIEESGVHPHSHSHPHPHIQKVVEICEVVGGVGEVCETKTFAACAATHALDVDPIPKSRSKPKGVIPLDFAPTEDSIAHMMSVYGVSRADVDARTEEFRHYWGPDGNGAGDKKRDWQGTWRNRMDAIDWGRMKRFRGKPELHPQLNGRTSEEAFAQDFPDLYAYVRGAAGGQANDSRELSSV